MSETSIKHYDVIVVGGGMVGAALACCLGGSNLRVAVVERLMPEPFTDDQPHDLRVSALSIASKNILQMVGAWEGVVSRRFCPYRRMRVWEDRGDTEFNSDDIHCDELGFIVENRITQLAFLERLADFDNVDLLCPAAIKQIDYIPERPEIQLEDGSRLSCKLLVAADGGESRVRAAVGIGVTRWDYQQHALVIYIETEYGQQDITWQRFVPTGPQAFLPLNGHFASIVWYNSADAVRRLKNLSHAALREELMQAFPDCLGQVKRVLATARFPLRRQHAQAYVKQGVALVGDAAHMINPLAGQGVNIGLLDAAALAEVLLDAHNKGKDIGSVAVLNPYQKMRRNENLKMMTLMDIFYRVFSNRIPPLKLLRNLGLGLAGRIRPAKNKVMRYAMGLEGKLPKLAKGQPIQ